MAELKSAEAHKLDGNAAFKQGAYAKAVASYTIAIRKSNGRTPAYFTNRAIARLKLQGGDDALTRTFAAQVATDQTDRDAYEEVLADCERATEGLRTTVDGEGVGLDSDVPGVRSSGGIDINPMTGAKTMPVPAPAADPASKDELVFMKAGWYAGIALLKLDRPHAAYTSLTKSYRAAVRQANPKASDVLELVLEARRKRWERSERDRIAEEAVLATRLRRLVENDRERLLSTVSSEEARDVRDESDETLRYLDGLLSRSDERARKRDVPDHLICPISLQIMVDPVVSKSGRSFDRQAILEHLRHHPFDPLTREPMLGRNLVPNLNLREVVESFLQENGWAADY
ncbi:hypothetical protein PYCC9005_001960 [Savitreella phatthalungensis]